MQIFTTSNPYFLKWLVQVKWRIESLLSCHDWVQQMQALQQATEPRKTTIDLLSRLRRDNQIHTRKINCGFSLLKFAIECFESQSNDSTSHSNALNPFWIVLLTLLQNLQSTVTRVSFYNWNIFVASNRVVVFELMDLYKKMFYKRHVREWANMTTPIRYVHRCEVETFPWHHPSPASVFPYLIYKDCSYLRGWNDLYSYEKRNGVLAFAVRRFLLKGWTYSLHRVHLQISNI